MAYFFYFFLFIFGLAVGSFINVISIRYRFGKKLLSENIISGRSHCLDCKKKLLWYELVPLLSFIFQGGKCRHCKKNFSFQYPLVEILSGLIFVFIPFYLTSQLWPIIVIWLLIFSLFLLLSIIDFRLSIIPDQINLSLAILGLILIGFKNYYGSFGMFSGSYLRHFAAIFGWRNDIWLNHIFAVFVGLAIFLLIVVLSKGKAMGWGDVKLVGALGLIFGWPDAIMVLTLAFIIGAFVGIILMIIGTKNIKDMIPFGPFLIISSAVTFFFGYEIIYGYFKLFGMV